MDSSILIHSDVVQQERSKVGDTIPPEEYLIITGDFNACIGKEPILRVKQNSSNEYFVPSPATDQNSITESELQEQNNICQEDQLTVPSTSGHCDLIEESSRKNEKPGANTSYLFLFQTQKISDFHINSAQDCTEREWSVGDVEDTGGKVLVKGFFEKDAFLGVNFDKRVGEYRIETGWACGMFDKCWNENLCGKEWRIVTEQDLIL
ncbi:hypothetical protein FQA39_LY06550 [Lamprigera yunnana]|nr:hypothetical protein FQA39_LY06550 [Lamprigera yunnana]